MRTYALERDIERLQSRLTSVEEDYADAEKSLEAVRADLRAAEGRVEELEAKLLAAEKAREAWTETARMHAKNEAYYRDLIVRTLSGTPAAFVSDDGSVQQDVICAKLPELYAASEKARKEAERERDAYRHEWNVSSRQQGAETRTRYAAESRAARLEEKAKKTLPLLCFAFGFIGSIVKCKDARFATSLPHLAQWTEEAGAALAAEEGK